MIAGWGKSNNLNSRQGDGLPDQAHYWFTENRNRPYLPARAELPRLFS